jgi:hypothetical protein
MDRRYLLAAVPVVLWGMLSSQPAAAGIFSSKKPKPTPAERVPELIMTLRTDGDEHKRCSAAEELRQYDPTQFPEMIPALIDALLNDKKPSVRADSAQTLGKLRPVSSAAGAALEQAMAKDASMRVRLQARSSLAQYRWAGYTPKPKDEPPAQSKEPPLAPDLPTPAAPAPTRLTPVPAATATQPPRPLPVGRTAQSPAPAPASGPSAVPPVPAAPVSLKKTAKPAEEQGPDLTPP